MKGKVFTVGRIDPMSARSIPSGVLTTARFHFSFFTFHSRNSHRNRHLPFPRGRMIPKK
jgi:hypothetical protein